MLHLYGVVCSLVENGQLLHPKLNYVRLKWPIKKDYIQLIQLF